MVTFEEIFSNVETGAEGTKKAATSLAKNANQLRKAAQEGNIAGIKKASERLGQSFDALQQVVATASSAWSLTETEASNYIAENYADELCRQAKELGFDIFERDGVLISYPSTIRLLSAEQALRIDRKKIPNIRPSKLARTLLANKEKGATFKPTVFLEALYKAYNIIARSQKAENVFNHNPAPVVKLEEIYEVFTSLPGSKRDYDRMDFARDIYFLDTGKMRATKSGVTVSFPTSTGLKSGRGIFSFVGRDGNTINYYGIQFSGGR